MRQFAEQKQPTIGYPRVGQPAPQFEAESNYGAIRLRDYVGKWVVVLSRPEDFCPTWANEIQKFTEGFCDLCKLNCTLLGIVGHDVNSPLLWPQNIQNQFGAKIWFPVIPDSDHELARLYGMIDSENDEGVNHSVYIIDDRQILRAIVYYEPETDETISRVVRLVKLLQQTNATGIVTPDNWRPGGEWMLTGAEEDETSNELDPEVGTKEPELWYF